MSEQLRTAAPSETAERSHMDNYWPLTQPKKGGKNITDHSLKKHTIMRFNIKSSMFVGAVRWPDLHSSWLTIYNT